jgi:hypothetical protein
MMVGFVTDTATDAEDGTPGRRVLRASRQYTDSQQQIENR